MAVDSPIPSIPLAQLGETARNQVAATLAAALITASGRPYSIAEAIALKNDVYYALYPNPGSGAYQAWEKTKEERLKKIHGPA